MNTENTKERPTFRLCGERILVTPPVLEKKTEAGVILPDKPIDQKQPFEGEIVLIGSAVVNESALEMAKIHEVNLGVDAKDAFPGEIGDTILYGQHAGSQITLPEGKFIILYKSDVIGIK